MQHNPGTLAHPLRRKRTSCKRCQPEGREDTPGPQQPARCMEKRKEGKKEPESQLGKNWQDLSRSTHEEESLYLNIANNIGTHPNIAYHPPQRCQGQQTGPHTANLLATMDTMCHPEGVDYLQNLYMVQVSPYAPSIDTDRAKYKLVKNRNDEKGTNIEGLHL